eukprot:Sspe_Gene.75580::Locus_47218_Transcript_3_4_Confidence_0.250_Length_1548::g.75580::m.75580
MTSPSGSTHSPNRVPMGIMTNIPPGSAHLGMGLKSPSIASSTPPTMPQVVTVGHHPGTPQSLSPQQPSCVSPGVVHFQLGSTPPMSTAWGPLPPSSSPPLRIHPSQGPKPGPAAPPVNPLKAVVKDVRMWGLTVTDPLRRRKVACPHFKMEYTNGMADCTNTQNNHSICILFQGGNCRRNKNCNQIHVERLYYNLQRQASSPCCASHNDLFTAALYQRRFFVMPSLMLLVHYQGNPLACPWPADLVSLSVGLSNCPMQLFDGVPHILIEDDKVCQNWQESRCTYGKECNYVHLCRTMYQKILRDKPRRRETPPTTPDSVRPSMLCSSASPMHVMPPPVVVGTPPMGSLFPLSAHSQPTQPIPIPRVTNLAPPPEDSAPPDLIEGGPVSPPPDMPHLDHPTSPEPDLGKGKDLLSEFSSSFHDSPTDSRPIL